MELTASIRRLNAIKTAINEAAQSVDRRSDDITLVVVSKYQSLEATQRMAEAGAKIFGESRVQEALPKIQALANFNNIEYHFIGRLQTNKVRQVVGNFSLIHSVDNLELAESINKTALKQSTTQNILIQINVSGEKQKGGIEPDKLKSLLEAVYTLPNVCVRGFMMMPPFENEPETNRTYFRQAKEIFNKYKTIYKTIDTLSMGMSGDFNIAVQEGATMVRIGTALFID